MTFEHLHLSVYLTHCVVYIAIEYARPIVWVVMPARRPNIAHSRDSPVIDVVFWNTVNERWHHRWCYSFVNKRRNLCVPKTWTLERIRPPWYQSTMWLLVQFPRKSLLFGSCRNIEVRSVFVGITKQLWVYGRLLDERQSVQLPPCWRFLLCRESW